MAEQLKTGTGLNTLNAHFTHFSIYRYGGYILQPLKWHGHVLSWALFSSAKMEKVSPRLKEGELLHFTLSCSINGVDFCRQKAWTNPSESTDEFNMCELSTFLSSQQ